jgi:hypothetical protein
VALKEAAAPEFEMLTVRGFDPPEVGENESCPVVQVLPAVRTEFAVQVPSASEYSPSEKEKGVAPKVTEPPFAVRVTVPQVPVVFTPCMAEQLNEVGLTVRYAFEVPERLKVVPVPLPEEALTVTVSDLTPAVVGLKVMVPVLQELPEAIVEFAVQVPEPTVKSVESEFENGVAAKVTSPFDAVSVIEPVHVLLEPELTAVQEMEPALLSVP